MFVAAAKERKRCGIDFLLLLVDVDGNGNLNDVVFLDVDWNFLDDNLVFGRVGVQLRNNQLIMLNFLMQMSQFLIFLFVGLDKIRYFHFLCRYLEIQHSSSLQSVGRNRCSGCEKLLSKIYKCNLQLLELLFEGRVLG